MVNLHLCTSDENAKGQPNKIKQGYANTCGTIKAEANISNHFREDGVGLGVPKSLSQILSS